jgi:hypothetical protein
MKTFCRAVLAVVSATFLAACSHQGPPVNGPEPVDYRVYEPLAIDLVWQSFQADQITNTPGTFGPDFTANIASIRAHLPPTILYREAPTLDCDDGRGFSLEARTLEGRQTSRVGATRCARGVYNHGPYTATVAWARGMKFSQSSFAHELCHAFYGDEGHEICHNDGGPVLRANTALQNGRL